MIDSTILKSDERAILALRTIYKQYGYMPFKMSKFEEYDLYLKNKDFLLSDRIITFNDTTGKLLALKPDVTLSIIKNAEGSTGSKYKVYYNENVYRVSPGSRQYKEIMQTGLECIGDIGVYDTYETVLLAAKSLEAISDNFVLDISDLGILTAALDTASSDESFRARATKCIKEKNEHDLKKICREANVSNDAADMLASIAAMRGSLGEIIPELERYAKNELMQKSIAELKTLNSLIEKTPFAERIFFDFSVINDMNYYSGAVFRGFIDGIPEAVLAGGRYDKLIERMGGGSGGIGFAIYLDLIENIGQKSEYDVDVLLIADDSTTPDLTADRVSEYTNAGYSVSVQKSIPDRLRYKKLVRLAEEVKND